MTQSELFNPIADDPSRAHADINSKEAHEKLKSRKMIDQARVFCLIHKSGGVGMNLEQLGWAMGKTPSAISGRLTELRAAGSIYRKAERGRTTSGNSCWIYVAVGK